MKLILKCIHDEDSYPKCSVVYTTNAESLDEILPSFEEFLRGCGFHFNGHLEFMNEKK